MESPGRVAESRDLARNHCCQHRLKRNNMDKKERTNIYKHKIPKLESLMYIIFFNVAVPLRSKWHKDLGI